MRPRRYGFFVLLLSVMLGGCALWPGAAVNLPPRETLDAFSLEGRFSLLHENKNYSGRISWRHEGAHNEVLLSSPFGQGLAEIVTREDGAWLTASDGKVHAAANAETLTRQTLGYSLPLGLLTDWVRGRSSSGGVSEMDAFGRLLRLQHAGWKIDYGYETDDPEAPPVRIFADRPGEMELRLRIDEWNALPGSSPSGAPTP